MFSSVQFCKADVLTLFIFEGTIFFFSATHLARHLELNSFSWFDKENPGGFESRVFIEN